MSVIAKATFLAALIMVVAGARAPAQGPLTADSLTTIVTAGRAIATEIRTLYWSDSDVQARAKVLVADFAKHNAEPCEFPQGQPELCANYEAERVRLAGRSADLQKEMKAIAASRSELQKRFAVLMTRLRTGTYAASVAKKKESLVACSALDPVSAAVECLDKIVPATRRPTT